MQVRKVAVVATGALATAAAMGSTPAFAADSASAPEVAPATVGVLDAGKSRASDEAMREVAEQWLTVAPERTWSAPWEQEPPQILSLGTGSALSVAPWQMCASHGPWIGGLSVPLASPATVLGDCRNGNIDLAGGGSDALISVLDNTAVSALAFQMCGSGVGALGATVPLASPTTVTGSCDNGNITISEPKHKKHHKKYKKAYDDGYAYHQSGGNGSDHYYLTEGGQEEAAATEPASAEPASTEPAAEQTVVPRSAPWEQDPPQILSAASGSAASALSWQMCASPGPWILGASAPVASPMTVLDDCRNGNIDLHNTGSDALLSLLDGSAVSAAAFQMCGSGTGALGITVPVASPMTVGGGCDNGNISID